MHPISADRIFGELRACTAELAEIVGGDLARPVPTCPEWTFRQLATHVGRGHRWAAEIVATRAAEAIALRQVPGGEAAGRSGAPGGVADPAIEILGDQTLVTDWLDHTPF